MAERGRKRGKRARRLPRVRHLATQPTEARGDDALRAFVRVLARQAARELFESEARGKTESSPLRCSREGRHLRPLLVGQSAGGVDRRPVPRLPGVREAQRLEGRAGVLGSRDVGRNADASRLSGDDGCRAPQGGRRRPRRVARSLQPRPGRHRGPVQAPRLRRRFHRDPVRRRPKATSRSCTSVSKAR